MRRKISPLQLWSEAAIAWGNLGAGFSHFPLFPYIPSLLKFHSPQILLTSPFRGQLVYAAIVFVPRSMRNHNSSKTSERTNPPGLPGSAGEAAPPRAFAHKRKVLKRKEMPKLRARLLAELPGRGGGKETVSQGPRVHPCKLANYRPGDERLSKSDFLTIASKSSSAQKYRNGWGDARDNFGEIFLLRKAESNWLQNSASEIKVTALSNSKKR